MAEEKNQHQRVVSTAEISEILGLTDRRIQQLLKDGTISRIDRGKFDLPKTIQQYIAWSGMKKEQKNEQTDDYKREKALLVRANRQKAELELQTMCREPHHSDDVKREINNMVAVFRTRTLMVPEEVAPQVAGKTELPIIQEIIKKEVYETLTELSNYNPA